VSDKIDIITSLYKAEDHIENFLLNVASQTIFNQCCLNIVNCCGEKEDEFIKKFQEAYPDQVKYYKFEECVSIYETWNFLIRYSENRFITNWNVDDRRTNSNLERHFFNINLFDADLVYGGYLETNIANDQFDSPSNKRPWRILPHSHANLLQYNYIHCGPMWRRSLHNQFGFFSEDLNSASDYEFWLRCSAGGANFKDIQEYMTLYYRNPSGASSSYDTLHDSVGEVEKVRKIYKNA